MRRLIGLAGTRFYLMQTEEFARDVLPRYFKHNRYASFVRQLNLYGAMLPVTSSRIIIAHTVHVQGSGELQMPCRVCVPFQAVPV